LNGDSLVRLFHNEKFVRIAGPTVLVLGIGAGIWHATHAVSAWRQSQQWKTTDPALSEFFWSAFQTELGVTVASFIAAFFARIVFDVRRIKPPGDGAP
jgi:hypothetical protein